MRMASRVTHAMVGVLALGCGSNVADDGDGATESTTFTTSSTTSQPTEASSSVDSSGSSESADSSTAGSSGMATDGPKFDVGGASEDIDTGRMPPSCTVTDDMDA